MFDFSLRQYTTGPNYKAGAVFIDTYLCPSDGQGRELVQCCSGNTNGTSDAEDLARTNMAGVSDSKDWTCDGFWPGRNKDGMMFGASKVTTAKIGDGTSHTLTVGEIVGGGQGSNKGFFWTTWNVLHTKNGLNLGVRVPIQNAWSVAEGGFASFHPGGLHFSMADGSATYISESIDYATLIALTTRDSGDIVSGLSQ
jgi:prepilin-type processing-associated H-X9-DG protein